MTPADVKEYYRTGYNFRKHTGMSCSSLGNWLKWGFIPYDSQKKIEKESKGKLKAKWVEK